MERRIGDKQVLGSVDWRLPGLAGEVGDSGACLLGDDGAGSSVIKIAVVDDLSIKATAGSVANFKSGGAQDALGAGVLGRMVKN